MRFLPLILSLALLTGCATEWHPAMPNAHKYENNAKAIKVYMHAFGVGFQNGWEMITTDMTPWDIVFKNDDLVLQSASLDGFNDGEHAAWKARDAYDREFWKRGGKYNTAN
jgi:hypothetical protein